MNRSWLFSLFLLSSSLAFAHEGHEGGQHMGFTDMDRDGDGLISREEAAGNPRLSEHFDSIDVNKDGKLSRDEVKSSFRTMHEHGRQQFDEAFTKADSDSDGKLSLAEAQAGMPRLGNDFNELDANKDGYVTREEIKAHMDSHRPHRHPPQEGTDTSKPTTDSKN